MREQSRAIMVRKPPIRSTQEQGVVDKHKLLFLGGNYADTSAAMHDASSDSLVKINSQSIPTHIYSTLSIHQQSSKQESQPPCVDARKPPLHLRRDSQRPAIKENVVEG